MIPHTPPAFPTFSFRRSRTLFLAFLFVLAGVSLSRAQQFSDAYYTGSGEGSNLETARQAARQNLSQQIQVFIFSSFQHTVAESAGVVNQKTAASTIARSVVMLKDVVEKVSEAGGGRVLVTMSVSKASVRQMFNERRDRLLQHVRIAHEELARKDNAGVNIGLALKNLYWAKLLAGIQPDTVWYDNLQGSRSLATAGLPGEIESVIGDITAVPLRQIDDQPVTWKCNVSYHGMPVRNLRFEFHDGVGTTLGEVSNGQTQLSLYFPGGGERDIPLSVDYRYEDEMDELLLLADSLASGHAANTGVLLRLSGSPVPKGGQPPPPAVNTATPSLPPPLLALWKVKANPGMVLQAMKTLVKQGKIIVGTKTDFESTEGLYVAAISRDGLHGLLQCKKEKFFDAVTGVERSLQDFAGDKITWIEVLK